MVKQKVVEVVWCGLITIYSKQKISDIETLLLHVFTRSTLVPNHPCLFVRLL